MSASAASRPAASVVNERGVASHPGCASRPSSRPRPRRLQIVGCGLSGSPARASGDRGAQCATQGFDAAGARAHGRVLALIVLALLVWWIIPRRRPSRQAHGSADGPALWRMREPQKISVRGTTSSAKRALRPTLGLPTQSRCAAARPKEACRRPEKKRMQWTRSDTPPPR